MRLNQYEHFTTQDFLEDEAFRNWALFGEAPVFWQALIETYPSLAPRIQEAKILLLAIQQEFERRDTPQEKEAVLERVFSQTSSRPMPARRLSARPRRVATPLAIAAAVALLGICLFWLFLKPADSTMLVQTTQFGEQRQISLPDGSTVYLNAHSSIRYARTWKSGEAREVWLDGEAFFSVLKKQEGKLKFTVHTDDLSVEVLGTQFNVNTRKIATQVVLKEGKIRLRLDNQRHRHLSGEMEVSPGELVEYSSESGSLKREQVRVQQYSSWREGIIEFEDRPLWEVAEKIEELYGIKVVFPDSVIRSQRVRMSLPVEDKEVFLQTFQRMENARMIDDSTMMIYNK